MNLALQVSWGLVAVSFIIFCMSEKVKDIDKRFVLEAASGCLCFVSFGIGVFLLIIKIAYILWRLW